MNFVLKLSEYSESGLILSVMTNPHTFQCDTMLDDKRLQALGIEYLMDIINISKHQIKNRIENDAKAK